MKKSNEMPEPQVMNYDVFYKVTPMFINDLKIVMTNGGVAYVDAKKIFDKITENKMILPSALLNELVRDLGRLPYKVVANLMQILEDKEKFSKYFELIQLDKKTEK